MLIHFFTKSPKSIGSSRQRAFLISQELIRTGIASIVHTPPVMEISETPWPSKIKLIIQILKILSSVKKDDVIILQRTVYNKYFWLIILIYKIFWRRRMYFDIDDAVYEHSFFKTKILVKLCDGVFAGSHGLADWCKQFNSNVHVIPTGVDLDEYLKYQKKYQNSFKELVIGWIGGASYHYDNLQLLIPIFKILVDRKINFKFKLIGAMKDERVYKLFNSVKGLKVEFTDNLDWATVGIVPKTIQSFDIGVMPLTDSKWNKSKCAFKAIEYMACGVVTVLSPVGENKYLVKNGVNGFLPENTEEWVKIIIDVYNSRIDNSRVGTSAIITIRDKYSIEVLSKEILKVISK